MNKELGFGSVPMADKEPTIKSSTNSKMLLDNKSKIRLNYQSLEEVFKDKYHRLNVCTVVTKPVLVETYVKLRSRRNGKWEIKNS
jgi:hypothetical protein